MCSEVSSNNKTVQVAVRIRPLVPNETSKGCKNVLEVYSDISQIKIKGTDKAFTYNHVFDSESSQDDVYNECVKKMVGNIFKGYNLTILAYGQTGSGKTHSMGTAYRGEDDMGVIPRAINDIFAYIRDNFSFDFTLTVSFMELYQEVLYDLLSDKPRDQCVLDIREDPTKGIVIPGLTEIPVENPQDVFNALMRGSAGRATGATNMNAQSSRSHAIFTVNLCMQSKTNHNENRTAKFHLVDLAGSERPKKTGAVGTTFKEGVNINKGLLVLGNVISALGDGKFQNNFIPYRDSNLTRLLKDSLGGNSITLMLACVSPADYNVEETISTLRYADRARKIQNKPIVNQDAKAAEINELKKQVQHLKLQIMGQGGPMVCPAEIELLKKDNGDLRMKIAELNYQLSTTLNDNTGLLEKIMILQNANEKLHGKIQELKAEYDNTLDEINANDGGDSMKNDLLIRLQKIQESFVDLTGEQKRTESEILKHEEDLFRANHEGNSDARMSQDQENFTTKQMALNTEVQELTKQLALKEHLARQIITNARDMVDYAALAENEAKILHLQKEKDELLQQLKSVQPKLAEQRRKRVQELEAQIQQLNRKVQEQGRMIKLKEKDEVKIKQLNGEILQMKQTRVKLIRRMREESDRFRAWKMQRERELAKLKQMDSKKQSQIVKMAVIHSKQQNVLKRKVEEAVALNKRLKDALALRKTAQDSKNSGKNERLTHWIKQEFDVVIHLVEAKSTLAGLLEDRGILQQQLDALKDRSDVDENQIRSIEEDIELRSTQIQDLQQKLLDSDEDNKSRLTFDNVQTMGDAKFALKTLMDQAVAVKKDEVAVKVKMIELQAIQAELTEKLSSLETKNRLLEQKHAEDCSNLQKEYEEKVSVLLRQLRGVKGSNEDEDLQKRCAIQGERMEELEQTNDELKHKLTELEEQVKDLTRSLDTVAYLAQTSSSLKTPSPKPKRSRRGENTVINDTFTVPLDKENLDITDDDVDDLRKDPDWKQTPLGKWLLERRRRITITRNLSDETVFPLKRTSDGGCLCEKGKCTTRCRCRKGDKPCTSGCKCSKSLCTNRRVLEDSNTGSENEGSLKKQRILDNSYDN